MNYSLLRALREMAALFSNVPERNHHLSRPTFQPVPEDSSACPVRLFSLSGSAFQAVRSGFSTCPIPLFKLKNPPLQLDSAYSFKHGAASRA
jgi:hypothetical protein